MFEILVSDEVSLQVSAFIRHIRTMPIACHAQGGSRNVVGLSRRPG